MLFQYIYRLLLKHITDQFKNCTMKERYNRMSNKLKAKAFNLVVYRYMSNNYMKDTANKLYAKKNRKWRTCEREKTCENFCTRRQRSRIVSF